MSNLTVGVLSYALDGLNLAQQAASNNIANVATPGYTAQEVDFESSLANALAQGTGSPTVSPSVYASGAPAATNGNNVVLSQEMANIQTDTLQYQALVGALNANFQVMNASYSANF